MAKLDALRELFQTVLGRPPVGKATTAEAMMETQLRLRRGAGATAATLEGICIPNVLLGFHSVFGGEKAPVSKYYYISSIEMLIPSLSHVIFASDPRSGLSYGMSYSMLEYDDPLRFQPASATMCASGTGTARASPAASCSSPAAT